MKTFHLAITDIASIVFEEDAQSLSCTGAIGDMTILAGHMPLVTTLKPGTIRVTDAKGGTHEFPATGGILEVTTRAVTILL
ncbi:MAG: hypothetical protein AAB805_02045 [Patescibacteria group bacterium]